MNFYYDPILGLQYTFLDALFIIDLLQIPKFDIEQWRKCIREMGVMLVEPSDNYETYIVGQITDYRL